MATKLPFRYSLTELLKNIGFDLLERVAEGLAVNRKDSMKAAADEVCRPDDQLSVSGGVRRRTPDRSLSTVGLWMP